MLYFHSSIIFSISFFFSRKHLPTISFVHKTNLVGENGFYLFYEKLLRFFKSQGRQYTHTKTVMEDRKIVHIYAMTLQIG